MDVWIIYKNNTSVLHFASSYSAALHLTGKQLSHYIVVKQEHPSAPRVVVTSSSDSHTGIEELDNLIQAT